MPSLDDATIAMLARVVVGHGTCSGALRLGCESCPYHTECADGEPWPWETEMRLLVKRDDVRLLAFGAGGTDDHA